MAVVTVVTMINITKIACWYSSASGSSSGQALFQAVHGYCVFNLSLARQALSLINCDSLPLMLCSGFGHMGPDAPNYSCPPPHAVPGPCPQTTHLRAWTRLRLANSWQSTKAWRTFRLVGSLGRGQKGGWNTLGDLLAPPPGGG